MNTFRFFVKNLRALEHLDWSPSEVSLLIGANGAGKSTTLRALKLLRTAIDRGCAEAVNLTFGGPRDLKYRHAEENAPVEIGLLIEETEFKIRLLTGIETALISEVTIRIGDRTLPVADPSDPRITEWANTLGIGPPVASLMQRVRHMTVFSDPDLYGLRGGSNVTHTRHLHSRGSNAITMLRGWLQRRADRHRYDFVLTGLRAAFPALIADLEFEEAGNTIALRVFPPGSELSAPLGTEANGVLAMLVLLCNLAAAEHGGIVAIDEPENSLHPFAIRVFLQLAEQCTRTRDLTVILATHSPVLLDAFTGTPEHVHVLDVKHTPVPVALNSLKNPEWLRQFRLGELYTDDAIVSNDESE